MVCLDEGNGDAVGVGDWGGSIKRDWVDEMGWDAEHVLDEVGGALRAVDRAVGPG